MSVRTIYHTVTRAWTHQVRRNPRRTALVSGDLRLSFAELDEHADHLARWLVDEGAGPELVVANRLPRSAEALVVQLAVLKSGAVHVAVPPDEPPERASAILRDADPAITLGVAAAPAAQRTRPMVSLPEDAVYLTYPRDDDPTVKGVVVEHRNLANLLEEHYHSLFRWAVVACGMGPLRVGHSVPLTRDDSWSLLLWLISGHELHLVPDQVLPRAASLAAFVEETRLDVLTVDVTMLESLFATEFLRGDAAPGLLLVGDGAIGEDLWRELRFASDTSVVNLYGPSECTVFCTRAIIDGQPTPNIGVPVANTDAVVVDDNEVPVAPGVDGELVISGAAVARGYHDPAEPTGSRFTFPRPQIPERRYWTGDLVRRLPTGALEYRGRADGRAGPRDGADPDGLQRWRSPFSPGRRSLS